MWVKINIIIASLSKPVHLNDPQSSEYPCRPCIFCTNRHVTNLGLTLCPSMTPHPCTMINKQNIPKTSIWLPQSIPPKQSDSETVNIFHMTLYVIYVRSSGYHLHSICLMDKLHTRLKWNPPCIWGRNCDHKVHVQTS